MNEHNRPPLQPITDIVLDGNAAIRHGFFTRNGGVSQGLYAGLNAGLGSGDDQALVAENRRRIADWLGTAPQRLSGCHQIHSANVIAIDAPIPVDGRPEADALVTATPGLPIAVLTADCAPVLFADPAAGVVGAAHAGWKGALGGVLENTIAAMVALGATRTAISAIVGPTISQANYEVGPEFRARFVAANQDHARWFTPSAKADHFMFDLPGLCVTRLKAAGAIAANVGQCTYADEERFFSYRRTTHRGEPDYGRQLSAIMIA